MLRTVAVCLVAAVSAQAAKPAAPRPNVTAPTAFRNQAAGAANPENQWWKGFGDPLLDRLVQRAERNNLDVRKAAARLAEAEASRKSSRAALLPDISATASASKTRGGFSQGIIKAPTAGGIGGNLVTPFDTSVVSAGFEMRWEIDVFGGLRKSLQAAAADAQAASENVRDAQTIVRAEVARNYVELRAAEDQIAIVRATVASEEELLALVRARADAGLASDLDVEREAAQLASFRAALPDLDVLRLQAIYRIGVLLGEQPTGLQEELEAAHPTLQVPPAPLGVPSEELKVRPDIRRAEAQIAAAFARAGSARADLYPKIVITGLSGRQATDVAGLTLGAGNFFSFGPGISLPILNFGRIRAQIAARDAQLDQAVHSFEEDVLAAFEETENAFVARDRAEQRQHELDNGLTAARRTVELSRELYVRGLGDFLSVLDAQRQQFAIERDLAASNASVMRATVALYKALGR
jgi:NodT family efflux transporter outer membrane factor (OMF) lipoprotein